MHHLYPSLKGDQLCPLGFHPQTRYPTRCKRCFRDYKEHGGRRGMDDVATSSPNLSDSFNSRPSSRTWTSTQNLSSVNGNGSDIELKKRPQSWASTPDIDEADDHASDSPLSAGISGVDDNSVNVTIKLPTPQRRHTTALDIEEVENTLQQSSSTSSSTKTIPEDLVILSTDSLAERVRKMNLLKKQRSENSRESSRERSVSMKGEGDSCSEKPPDRPERSKSTSLTPSSTSIANSNHISKTDSRPPKKKPSSFSTPRPLTAPPGDNRASLPPTAPKSTQIKLKTTSSASTITSTASTSAAFSSTSTIRGKEADSVKTDHDSLYIKKTASRSNNDPLEEVKSLRKELELMKSRAEKAEREKSDIMLRRLASIDMASNRTAASEALILQHKLNEMKEQLEKITEEKRKLNSRMKDLESNPQSIEQELRRKLKAAEQICEELMEENQVAKKEILNLQAEMDEIQDTFRCDEDNAKSSLQKDLEKTTKNCRILSFKLKKCERKIEALEMERQKDSNLQLNARIKELEDELRFSQDLTKKLQAEADERCNLGKKKPPMLGALGKSTSADSRITRESLTRGGSQEDPERLLRDLQDSVERESDLKDQLKFAEEEADNLRKKVARMEDENDSLMMQLKKMATRARTRKLSPVPHRLAPEVHAERDEGISDEDDPTELRILLELNEQEASILRQKVDDLEKQNLESKRQIQELQDRAAAPCDKKRVATISSTCATDKKLKALSDELDLLRDKTSALEAENKRLQLQNLKKSSADATELVKLKQALAAVGVERDALQAKIKRLLGEAGEKLAPRSPIRVTDLTPKNQLKKWIEELEDEIIEMRALVVSSGAMEVKSLQSEKRMLENEVDHLKTKLSQTEADLIKAKITPISNTKSSELQMPIKKFEEETKQLTSKIKELDDKVKKQDDQIKQGEAIKTTVDQQLKAEKEKISKLEKDVEKLRKERDRLESKITQKDNEMLQACKDADKIKQSLEKEIKDLKVKSSKSDSKQVQDLKKQTEELQECLNKEANRYKNLNAQWEKMSEESILMRAQLTTERNSLQTQLNNAQQKISELEAVRLNRTELAKKLNEAQKKIQDLETKTMKSSSRDYERTLLQNKLDEKTQEYDRLRLENEMNIDLVFQLRKDNDDLNRKLSDFNRIEQAQSSINGHSIDLSNEIRALKVKLANAELQLKSEVASTRLRYEQQVKTLSGELTSMQRQCERFKKDRDTFKQMLESAQKKIGDLKANNAGRQSRGSMHSSDEDDKSKITYLEQQIGCLEDQLVEARLEVSKIKTELVSERSANEIKISEMQSKLNEFEEDRVIGSGRTKIPGMKTKLELSWQKEREDQQRLLQETSTLARDLRQTLFEVERERDKERLESKRRMEQLKRSTEEEMEEGRRKIAELQCDLLELRDVHAKLRTSNEKLRRERERYEKELIKRRMVAEGGERKLGALLHTVDELMRIAPELAGSRTVSTPNECRPESHAPRRNRSPSPSMNTSNVSSVLARVAEASEELRKFQRISEEEHERYRMRRSNLRRAASQENDPHGSQSSVASAASTTRNGSKFSRYGLNGSLIRKSLSLDHSIQKDQNIWRQDDGSVSSMQSIDSELGGMARDSSFDSRLDSRLSGGSTQSDIPRGPRKKKKGLIGKLRSLTKSGRNSESEISIQGSDSDISVASDLRSSKKDLRGRLSGMFKRSGSASRSNSTEHVSSENRPVAVTVVGHADGPQPRDPLPANALTPKPIRSITKPPTPTTPSTTRKLAK